MNREEVHKLLGGYATGTLTPEEQEALFAAALDDQELFDALAREQSLRDLLRDPAAKAQVLAALDPPHVPWYQRGWWRPAAVAVAMAGIAATVVVVTRKPAPAPETAILADAKESKAPTPQQFAAPAGEPAKTSLPKFKNKTEVVELDQVVRPVQAKPGSDDKALYASKPEESAASKDQMPPPPPSRGEPAPPAAPSVKEAAPDKEAETARASNQAIQAQIPPMPYAQSQQQQGFRDSAGGAGGVLGQLASPNARGLFYANLAANGPISGRVTDPANGVIAGAKVTAVQVDTDARFEASTDRDGMYTIPSVPRATYRISAEAPGFKRYARDLVIAGANERPRIDIQLEVGSVSETVEVTSAAPNLKTIASAGSGVRSNKKVPALEALATTSLAAAKGAGTLVLRLGLRCSILRRRAGSGPVEVALETPLDAGEQVQLKIVPNDRGYLRVWETSAGGVMRPVAGGPAQPLQAFRAGLPGSPSSGTRQFYVQFTRDRQPPPPLPKQATDNLIQNMANGVEQATYVVNRADDPTAQQLVVPITLTYK